jgi:chromosome segregation ATPase
MRLNKAPLMDKKGKIYNYQNILVMLKAKELLNSKITHKKIELKNIQVRVKKSLFIVQRSEDEMKRIVQRRLELLQAIEKVDDEIKSLDTMKSANNLDINRLEFSKRDLLEAFKQVEVRSRTQTNILNNTHKELEKWEIKKEEKTRLKDELFKEQMNMEKEYKQICEILATALGKEPLSM